MTAPLTSRRDDAPLRTGRPEAARRHLYELDVVRGLTMVGVVGVHTISWTTAPSSVAAGAITILLHFTRESFFTLMSFVLIFSYRQRPVSWGAFWAKRFPFVVLPYVVWTAIYLSITDGFWQLAPGEMAHVFGAALIEGTAWYHVYFLLVTMQIYLLFPLVVLLANTTRRHHAGVVVASLVLQLVAMSFAQYWTSPRGETGQWLWNHRDSVVISYQFFVVVGALAAWHVEDVLGCAREHLAWVRLGVAVMGVVTVAWYLLAVAAGESPSFAASVFQPVEVLWSISAVVGLLGAGVVWSNAAKRGGGGALIPLLSQQSFGIFLVHPLVINTLVVLGFVRLLRGQLPDLMAYAVVLPLVLVVATAFSVIASRTPLSLILTGRRRHQWRVAAPVGRGGDAAISST